MLRSCLYALSALFFLHQNSTQAQVLINEFSAANYRHIPDNYGDYEDWIELYNTSGSAVDLSGYHLSDRADEPTKWAIPGGTSIPAGGHLRFWCSGRNTTVGSHYHTNFKVSQTRKREGIYFNDPSGGHIDSNGIAIPNQSRHSWGRSSDGAADWVIFTNPTPGASNSGASYIGYAATPILSPDPGLHAGALSVSMSSPDAGLSIRYTTNGFMPTAASTLYSSPVNVATTTVIRAIAIPSDPDYLPSFVETNTYFVGSGHTIPVVSIAGDQIQTLLSGSFIEPVGSFEFFDASGGFLAEGVGDYNKHGNDSWAYPQRGLDYITRDQLGYASDINHPIFKVKDRRRFQRLILKPAANDNYPYEVGAHIRDAFVHTLSDAAQLRVDERTSQAAILYVNGQYWGVYEIREKVDDHDFTDYYYDQGEFDIDFIKTWGGTWTEYGSMADWNSLRTYIMSSDMTVESNYTYVDERLNTGSLIDYAILHSWIVCMDWLNWNTAWWRGRNPDGDKKKWRYALWDDDASFGHYVNYTGIPDTGPTADPCDATELSGWSDPEGHMGMIRKLMDNENFHDDYINRYADLNNYFFNCDFALPFLDSMLNVIRPEMPAQIARWGGNMTGWENSVTQLRDFIIARCGYIVSGMEDCFEEDAWPISIMVEPEGGGEVRVNTLDIPYYPFSALYFSGVNIDLQASESDGWVFDRWELLHHSLEPGITEPNVQLRLSSSDTIIAYFRITELPVFPIHVDVYPPGAGTVSINSIEPVSYPWTGGFTSGSVVSVRATAAEGYSFRNWNLLNQFINPSASDPNGFFSISTGDTLEAHFQLGTGLESPGSALSYFEGLPNPSPGWLQINWQLERGGLGSLELLSATGQHMATLLPPQQLQPGLQRLDIDLGSVLSGAGLYFLVLRVDGYQHTARVVYAP